MHVDGRVQGGWLIFARLTAGSLGGAVWGALQGDGAGTSAQPALYPDYKITWF